MAIDNIYPEDAGTNSGIPSEGGDDADAANFASVYHCMIDQDHVVTGLKIQNVGSGTFDITAGKAIITDSSADAAQSNEVRDQGVAYKVVADARTGLSYTSNDVTYVYLDPVLDTGNNVNITTNVTGTAPSDPSLKIAEVDDT